ncbi:kinase-like domain-containing protein [Trametes meyenii]|nr:kinase-like domain-containing protein [Trametes meyenii]
MKYFFAFFRNKAAARNARAQARAEEKQQQHADSVNIEAVQLVVEASKGVSVDEDVHVKLVFDDAGELVSGEVDRYKTEVSTGLSATSTLVEQSPVLPAYTGGGKRGDSPSLTACSLALPVIEFKRAAASRVDPASAHQLSTADFRPIKVLGRGGQGTVLLVQYAGDGRLYALKAQEKKRMEIREYAFVFGEQDAMRRVVGDARSAQLKASWEDKEYFYLLTDFYAGGDLSTHMVKGTFSKSDAPRICAQLVLSLEALHSRRIMHRDIKPRNVLFTRTGRAILADYGLARTYGRSCAQEPWREYALWDHKDHVFAPFCAGTDCAMDATRRGCGTLGYSAPEAEGGWAYSYEADVWSLGVVFYEMLNGKLPFGIRYESNDAGKVLGQKQKEPVMVNSDVDAAAHDLLYLMLEKDPLRRPSLSEIKAHAWFASINWDELAQCELPVPPRLAEDAEPTKEALRFEFGTPYPDGAGPHHWFPWVSSSLPPVVADVSNPSGKPLRGSPVQRSPPLRSASPCIGSPASPQLPTPAAPPPAFFAEYAFPAFFAPTPHGDVSNTGSCVQSLVLGTTPAGTAVLNRDPSERSADLRDGHLVPIERVRHVDYELRRLQHGISDDLDRGRKGVVMRDDTRVVPVSVAPIECASPTVSEGSSWDSDATTCVGDSRLETIAGIVAPPPPLWGSGDPARARARSSWVLFDG